jgi:hypothetical protein
MSAVSAITLMTAMEKLRTDMMSVRGISENTANQYMRHLERLNGDMPFRTLAFLHDPEKVKATLADKSPMVRRTHYAAAHAALSVKKSPQAIKLTRLYKSLMDDNNKDIAAAAPAEGEPTAKEAENWMSWDDIIKRRDEIGKDIADWTGWTRYLLLCLFTMTEPRRNKDYLRMTVVGGKNTTVDATKFSSEHNYCDINRKRFIFNTYKTAKTYGQQIIDIPPPLLDIIKMYMTFHPGTLAGFGGADVDAWSMPLLSGPAVSGQTLREDFITRHLNAALGKKIGCSMLRHIYLSTKFSTVAKIMKDSTATAAAMGHSTATQRGYLRVVAAAGAGSDNITHE